MNQPLAIRGTFSLRRTIIAAEESALYALWSAGRDTLDIARIMGVPESEVANRLPKILERHRHDSEWNFDRMRTPA